MLRDGCPVLDFGFLFLSFFKSWDIPVCTCMKYLFLNYNRMKEILDLIPSEESAISSSLRTSNNKQCKKRGTYSKKISIIIYKSYIKLRST